LRARCVELRRMSQRSNHASAVRRPIAVACALAVSLAVHLAAPAAGAEPWSAAPTVTVDAKAISFTNAGTTLHGTLYLPRLARPVPALVVFHGASEPLASTPLYRHLRDGLPQMGIAVLLFDRRGTGASSGDAHVSYETLADDGIAGARKLRGMVQIDAGRVGYWGISQGGWLATMAAVRDPRARFAVAVSAPLVTPDTQMGFAMTNRLRALGYGSADVASMLHARKLWRGYLLGTNSRDDAVAALAAIENEPWFRLMYLPSPETLTHDPATSSWRVQMDDDPLRFVKQVRIPTLFLLGASDPWIPVATTVDRLRVVARDHPSISYAVVPDANHLMMFPPAHEKMDDAQPAQVAHEAPQVPAYFLMLGAWLEHTLRT
jgi:pimeloyl-ACP methyl ester carboxylesterase